MGYIVRRIGWSAVFHFFGDLLAYLFGYRLQWFPISGYCDVLRPQDGVGCGGPVQWSYHLILPWLTFALAFAAMYTRMIRASLLETMHEDWVRTPARKGLSEWATLRRHSFHNAAT